MLELAGMAETRLVRRRSRKKCILALGSKEWHGCRSCSESVEVIYAITDEVINWRVSVSGNIGATTYTKKKKKKNLYATIMLS